MGTWRGRLVGAAAIVASVECLVGCLGGEPLGGHPTGAGGTGILATGGVNGRGGGGGDGGVGGDGDVGGTSPSTTGGGGVLGTGGEVGQGGTGPAQFCGEVSDPVALPAAPDVLILLDRSSSMNDDSNEMVCTGGCGASSKWAVLSAAIENLIRGNLSVNWGLALYGSDDACGVTAGAAVDVSQNSALSIESIESVLATTTPGGDAPTAAAIRAASTYLQSRQDTSPKYLLLATDGRSGCAPEDTGTADTDAVNVVVGASIDGIPTFVLGLAPASDASATAVLNEMAVNGGEQTGGMNAFYTTADIGSVFMPGGVLGDGCTLPLPYPLVGDTTLTVNGTTTNGSTVVFPQYPLDGWSFTDPTDSAIELNGSACVGAMSGSYTALNFYYQCGLQEPRERSGPSPER
jgi:hypothetical protein